MRSRVRVVALLGLVGLLGGVPVSAQNQDRASDQTRNRIIQQVQKELTTLSDYGVFDALSYTVEGSNVTLKGFASRPILKSSAENVVKRIEGVDSVTNQIEVLPLSPNDDQLRARVYARIYWNQSLSRYNPNRGSPIWISPARIAAGITNDPPPGNHPIHIIVKNGNVSLVGVVDTEGDKTMAGMQANQVPGAFSVQNELVVLKETNKQSKR